MRRKPIRFIMCNNPITIRSGIESCPVDDRPSHNVVLMFCQCSGWWSSIDLPVIHNIVFDWGIPNCYENEADNTADSHTFKVQLYIASVQLELELLKIFYNMTIMSK